MDCHNWSLALISHLLLKTSLMLSHDFVKLFLALSLLFLKCPHIFVYVDCIHVILCLYKGIFRSSLLNLEIKVLLGFQFLLLQLSFLLLFQLRQITILLLSDSLYCLLHVSVSLRLVSNDLVFDQLYLPLSYLPSLQWDVLLVSENLIEEISSCPIAISSCWCSCPFWWVLFLIFLHLFVLHLLSLHLLSVVNHPLNIPLLTFPCLSLDLRSTLLLHEFFISQFFFSLELVISELLVSDCLLLLQFSLMLFILYSFLLGFSLTEFLLLPHVVELLLFLQILYSLALSDLPFQLLLHPLLVVFYSCLGLLLISLELLHVVKDNLVPIIFVRTWC